MSQSSFGKKFTVTTWGESHGKALGAVVDGCPAGLSLEEKDIQAFLDRRRPGQSRYTTTRKEGDEVEILSGVFEGKTTGTPISLMVRNTDQRLWQYCLFLPPGTRRLYIRPEIRLSGLPRRRTFLWPWNNRPRSCRSHCGKTFKRAWYHFLYIYTLHRTCFCLFFWWKRNPK